MSMGAHQGQELQHGRHVSSGTDEGIARGVEQMEAQQGDTTDEDTDIGGMSRTRVQQAW